MKVVFSEEYKAIREGILQLVINFKEQGETLFDGKRNEIKVFKFEGRRINIKGFKRPNIINVIAYSYFRKSKAERSFEYAGILLSKGILTPFPIAFVEEQSASLIGRSYYVSEHLEYDFTFRDVNLDKEFTDREQLLRSFTRFTFELHEKEVYFLDHSPGNTLVKMKESVPQFYLIDLNRMKFQVMDFDLRMRNFARLTTDLEVLRIMADEYASLLQRPEKEVYERMLLYTNQFQEKRMRKKALKGKLKSLIGS